MKKNTMITLSIALSSTLAVAGIGLGAQPAAADDKPDVTFSAKELGTAVKTAQTKAKGTAVSAERDDDKSWEIEFRDGRTEISVEVSANGKKVLRTERDTDDDNSSVKTKVGIVKAAELALKANPGAIDEIELDKRDWDVSVDRKKGSDIDVHVNASNGKVTRSND